MKRFILLLMAVLSFVTGHAQGGYDPENPGDPNPYRKLTLSASPKAGGSAYTYQSGNQVGVGQEVTCYASASTYYEFVHWLKDGDIVSTDTHYTFTMPDSDVDMVAVFVLNYNPESPSDPQEVIPTHKVILTASPGKGGYFNSSAFKLAEGDSTNVYAYPNIGYKFEEWLLDGVLVSRKNPIKVKMGSEDLNYTATFTYNPESPSEPGSNAFNSATGEMIIDHFTAGSLSSAISNMLGDSYDYSQIQSLIVSGVMESYDFGFTYRMTNCSKIDLSRTSGYSEIPSYAFESASALEELYLSSCVSSIGSYAFSGCNNLSVLTCYAVVPPTLSSNALYGIDKSVVIKVPAQSVDLYKNADGWKDFTILPADGELHSLTVSLPQDASDGRYKNMNIELLNTTNNQRTKYLITDKTQYVFYNLLSSTSYNVSVKNAKDEVLGELTAIDIKDEDIQVAFDSLRQPMTVNISVLSPNGAAVTDSVTVKWYDAEGNLLAQGDKVSGVLDGSNISYTIELPQELLMQYTTPTKQSYSVTSQANNVTFTLEALGKTTLVGNILDTEGKTISYAVLTISECINGSYLSSQNTTTNADGHYEIEVADVPLKINITANGYVSQTKELQQASSGIGDITLEKHTGLKIDVSYTFQESVADGDVAEVTNYYSDNSNIAYRVEDASGNELEGCTYQGSTIILPTTIETNSELTVTAYSKSNKFKDVSQSVTLDGKTTYITLPIVEYGGIDVRSANDAYGCNCILYDTDGAQVAKTAFNDSIASFSALPDGTYTMVAMKKSSLFSSVLNLSALENTELTRGTDYLVSTVNVASGIIANVALSAIPELDETKLYYTESDGTYFMPNKTQITIGNYLTLKSKVTLKDEYYEQIDAATLVVDIPSTCEFVDNSIISGNGNLDYTVNGNRISIPMKQLGDMIRFCIIPMESGEWKPSAFVQFVNNGQEVMQPIGSAYFEALNFSLDAPQKTSKTTIAIRGKATSDSEVLVYDNETLIGKTYSSYSGDWVMNISLVKPYTHSLHDIYGEIVTKDGKRLLTETKTVDYDQSYVDLSKVTMAYNGNKIVFDQLNAKTYPMSYSYVPGTDAFTFIADFTDNDTAKISSVNIKVLASDGSTRTLEAKYNAPTKNWVASTKYSDSNKLPVNATAEFEIETTSSLFEVDRYKDFEIKLDEEISYLSRIFIDGNVEIIKNTEQELYYSVIPEGKKEKDYMKIEQLDFQNAKANISMPFVHIENDTTNFYLKNFISNDIYSMLCIDMIREKAYSLTFLYHHTEEQERLNPKRILPLLLSVSWGIFNAGFEEHQNKKLVEYWRRQIIYDKERIQKNYADIINLLYAECPNGTLKIKDPFTLKVDEDNVDLLEKDAVDFLQDYKIRIDALEKYYRCQCWSKVLINSATSLITSGIGGIAKQFLYDTSPLVDNCIHAGVDIFGECFTQGVDNFITGDNSPDEVMSKWVETNSKKLTANMSYIANMIKADYSSCKEKEDKDDNNEEEKTNFPSPHTTPSVDPSGYVYEAVPSNRVQGVTTTAYYKQQTEDMYGDITETPTVWDATAFGQENPLLTDEQGMYAWDVPAGTWQVKFEKEGYETVYSEWLPVPPPQLEVNVAISQAKQPEVKTVRAYNDGINIEFDKFMLPSTLTYGNITVSQNGKLVEGSVALVDAESDASGNNYCSKMTFTPNEELVDGEATIFISKAVKSYANINMSEDFTQTFTIEPRIKEIVVNDTVNVACGETLEFEVSVLPITASKGKTVTIENLNSVMVDVANESVEIAEDGTFKVGITGLIVGNGSVKLSVNGYDSEKTIVINVTEAVEQTAAPTASVPSGEVEKGTKVTLSCKTPDAEIYYTTDGSCPCNIETANVYDGTPISINEDMTLKAMAKAPNMSESETAEFTYTVTNTGIEKISMDDNIKMYPLPVRDRLNISVSGKTINSVSIISVNGSVVITSNVSAQEAHIDISSLSVGTYILLVSTKDKVYREKILKIDE